MNPDHIFIGETLEIELWNVVITHRNSELSRPTEFRKYIQRVAMSPGAPLLNRNLIVFQYFYGLWQALL
jgi:hypothetical protein